MDLWTIAACSVAAHVLGSAVALALVSINRGESGALPPSCDPLAPVEPLDAGTVPRLPRWRARAG